MEYLKLLRVKHYIKNLLIFLPIVFAGKLFEQEYWMGLIGGFIAFCLMSSVVYVVNDIKDVEKDRLHPVKKNRPVAAGSISKKAAIFIACILLIGSIVCHCLFNGHIIVSLIVLLGYLLINLIYSVFGGKKVPLLDVTLLSLGFVLRVYYGAVITDLPVSEWLYLVIVTGAFYLGFGKRRNELVKNSNTTRDVLKYYNATYLDKMMLGCMILSIVFYALWCMERNRITNANYLITVPIIMLILFKYSMDIECSDKSDGDPVNVILNDYVLILLVVVLALFLGIMIYF